MKKKKTIILSKHVLVPKHVKLNEKEKKELFEQYKITFNELPKILKDDAAIHSLSAKPGDVIKIIRKSSTAAEAPFYRGVTNV
jgi:DNA-directed RNA polymerase subunit H|tara:strand:+ start:712 stop:960 length:249 start_codon:yes stop_codon:yes gene_type:complete